MDLSQMDEEIIDQRGSRIRSERLRLGMSQREFAELMGKKTMAVLRYEKGERTMSHEDLEALHRAGVDVWFLITGQRVSTSIMQLPADESEVLKLWQSVEPSQRKILLKLVINFAESFPIK